MLSRLSLLSHCSYQLNNRAKKIRGVLPNIHIKRGQPSTRVSKNCPFISSWPPRRALSSVEPLSVNWYLQQADSKTHLLSRLYLLINFSSPGLPWKPQQLNNKLTYSKSIARSKISFADCKIIIKPKRVLCNIPHFKDISTISIGRQLTHWAKFPLVAQIVPH